MRCNVTVYDSMPCNMIRYDRRCDVSQPSPAQHSMAQCSTVQHSTTTQYCAWQRDANEGRTSCTKCVYFSVHPARPFSARGPERQLPSRTHSSSEQGVGGALGLAFDRLIAVPEASSLMPATGTARVYANDYCTNRCSPVHIS